MGWYQRRVHGGPDTECSGPPTLVPKMPKVSRERSSSAFMAWMKEGANTSKDGSVKVHCRNGVFICNCSCTCIAHMRCICKADMPLDAPQTTRPLEGCTCWKLCNCGRTMSFEPPYDSVALSDFKKTGNQEDLQWPRCDSCISLGTAVAVAWLKKCRKEERRRRRKARAVV